MRFMVIVKANADSEAGKMPRTEDLAAMGKFNEEMVQAGVMLAGEGLHPSSKGARIDWIAGTPSVTDGPFTQAKELVAGFWLIRAKSKEEAVGWMSRAPFRDAQVEIRQVFEAEDFGDEFPPELRQQEERLRAKVAANK